MEERGVVGGVNERRWWLERCRGSSSSGSGSEVMMNGGGVRVGDVMLG